jgi:hypothetical protein
LCDNKKSFIISDVGGTPCMYIKNYVIILIRRGEWFFLLFMRLFIYVFPLFYIILLGGNRIVSAIGFGPWTRTPWPLMRYLRKESRIQINIAVTTQCGHKSYKPSASKPFFQARVWKEQDKKKEPKCSKFASRNIIQGRKAPGTFSHRT